MKIKLFILQYFTKPFVVWSIGFSILLKFIWIPDVLNLVTWILESQIYLVIFSTSFVHAYSQQMLPVIISWKEIREKQREDKWAIPRIMTNRMVMNITLWLSGVLFFGGLLMSFGILEPESIPDPQKYSEVRTTIQIIAIGLFAPVLYYSWEFEKIFQKYEIKSDKKDSAGILISVVVLAFFITLSYVAIICFNIIEKIKL